MTETDLINEVKSKRKELIDRADKKAADSFLNKNLGGKQGRDLAIPALILLLFILIVLSILTARYIIGDNQDINYYSFPEKTVIQKETITKNSIIERPLIIPEGNREVCIQLNNETFRRCFDE